MDSVSASHSKGASKDPKASTDYVPRRSKKLRACVSCHERKVKCDAADIGLPCTRCTARDETASCASLFVPERRNRASQKRSEPMSVSLQNIHPTQRARLGPSTDARSQRICLHCAKVPQHHLETSRASSDNSSHNERDDQPADDYDSSQVEQQSDSRVSFVANGVPDELPVTEEDAHLQICHEMSHWGSDSVSPTQFRHPRTGREVIEYHDCTNSITILSEILGRKRPRKLVRIVLEDSPSPCEEAQTRTGLENGLDEADIDYIRRKGAFVLPDSKVCDNLLQVYFSQVYPYAPIFNRTDFLHSYEHGDQSIFLLQAIFANVVPYISTELLSNLGFTDRHVAQKAFFSKAKLLYYLGCEKGQLQLLQGSIILSTMSFSYAPDNDYRFWLANAVRLATQLGLHRNTLAKSLDKPIAALLRRIWWVVYNRDVLLTVSGLQNVRRLHDDECDTAELTGDDWEEETLPTRFQSVMKGPSRLQKQYLIENGRLSKLSGKFTKIFRTPGKEPSAAAIEELQTALDDWRENLPTSFYTCTLRQPTPDNIWIFILLVESYRTECLFYRALRKFYKRGASASIRAVQMHDSAVYELNSLVEKICAHNFVQYCPLSLVTCVSTLLAMNFENAINTTNNISQIHVARMRIQIGLSYLRTSREYWGGVKWFLRIFEVIASRRSLLLEDDNSQNDTCCQKTANIGPTDPFSSSDDPKIRGDRSAIDQPLHSTTDRWETDLNGMHFDSLEEEYHSGIIAGRSSEDWLQELLGGDLISYDDYSTNQVDLFER